MRGWAGEEVPLASATRACLFAAMHLTPLARPARSRLGRVCLRHRRRGSRRRQAGRGDGRTWGAACGGSFCAAGAHAAGTPHTHTLPTPQPAPTAWPGAPRLLHETPCIDAACPSPPVAPLPPRARSAAHDLTCAVCLDTIALPDLALLPACDHAYCAPCILAWAVACGAAGVDDAKRRKEDAPCPQCKAPFATVVTHRRLDGSVTDAPAEESVCLLARARWFVDSRAAAAAADAKGKAPAAAAPWSDEDDEAFDDEEDFYFSPAAGRARIVLGNRRFGDGGVLAAGRRAARPALPRAIAGKGKTQVKGGNGGASSKTGAVAAAASSPGGEGVPAAAGKGRRARRAERRAAVMGHSDS